MICDRERDGKDYSPYECAKVLVGGEIGASGPFGLGRTRISLVSDFSRSTIAGFLHENIKQAGTIITTEDLESSVPVSLGYGHEVVRPAEVRDDLTSGFPPHIASLIHRRPCPLIDREVKGLVDRCYLETMDLLRANNFLLHKLAEVLLLHETIDAEELDHVVSCAIANKPEYQEKSDTIIPFHPKRG